MNVNNTGGALIAGFGIPGVGKSSIFKKLGETESWKCFLEPEEKEWPDAVMDRDVCGCVTALTWFRSMRVPQLFKAARLRDDGERVLIDSFYDKLVCQYLGENGMEWLISPDDPYFNVALKMSQLDYNFLPDCDCLVFFKVSEDDWHKMLRLRGRKLDKHDGFIQSFFTTDIFLECAKKYCTEKGARLIEFENKVTSIEDATARLKAEIFEAMEW